MALVSTSGLSLFFADAEIFSSITVEVSERARIGIVGPNGSGKTSFLKALVGEIEATAGDVHMARGIRIGYVSQTPTLMEGGSLGDEVMLAFEYLRRIEREVEVLGDAMDRMTGEERTSAEARYASLLHEYEDGGGYTYASEMERAVAGVGLSLDTLSIPSVKASGGERTRAALARALLAEPDVLILDEPTNHLDLNGLAWLEKFLSKFPHAFLAVSHDRYFLDRVVTEIWELDRGRLQVFPGNYSRYREQKALQTLSRQREYEKQQTYITKEEGFIRRYGAGQRSQQAQGRETRLSRLERFESPQENSGIRMQKVQASRSAQVVLRTRTLKVGFTSPEGPAALLDVPDLRLEKGSRTGIIGNNGSGKTTLLNTLLGIIPPISGTVSLGTSVKVGYHRQGLEDLPEEATVLEALLQMAPMSHGEARSYLARFSFLGEEAFQKVKVLSGGERGRLALARLLINAPNLLCLDEPTNHLDILSREALEEVLQDYDGTLLFVSHDRHLVSLLATQLWVVENGGVQVFPGTFQEWAKTQEDAPSASAKVRKIDTRPVRPKKAPAVKAKEEAARRISALEKRLQELESSLAAAAQAQDVASIAKLGGEHQAVQGQLDQAWTEWAS